ncbi:MAG TPA: DUF6249 domain-containing protein [Verrucomicrobiae bacterium]
MNQPSLSVQIVPVVAIIMGVGIGMLKAFFNYRKRKEISTLFHQERMAAIEKGLELPPLPDTYFGDVDEPGSPHRHLLAGLILLFVGAALMLALHVEAPGHALWGLIPISVGAAFLIFYAAVGRKAALEAEAKAKAAEAKT